MLVLGVGKELALAYWVELVQKRWVCYSRRRWETASLERWSFLHTSSMTEGQEWLRDTMDDLTPQ